MMAVDTIEITQGQQADELEVTVKLKGEPEAVIKALCHGLPREALMQMQDALGAELAKRAGMENPYPPKAPV